ncbi:MAG: exodeoxyribonuclease VII small subunit [Nanoarchaeota archaeon]|nr:exodeoxyribonuclease VII small subunit [Nanoarchaeota archaeon]
MENENEPFEKNLKKIEETVGSLEGGDLPLKETLEKFEEGIKLSKLCTEELEKAQQKIEKITEKDGKVISEPF